MMTVVNSSIYNHHIVSGRSWRWHEWRSLVVLSRNIKIFVNDATRYGGFQFVSIKCLDTHFKLPSSCFFIYRQFICRDLRNFIYLHLLLLLPLLLFRKRSSPNTNTYGPGLLN